VLRGSLPAGAGSLNISQSGRAATKQENAEGKKMEAKKSFRRRRS
jgi:hypothetical protein